MYIRLKNCNIGQKPERHFMACGKATLPNYGLGFGWAGFHAPTLVGGADAAHLQGAPHLLRPRLVAKPRCPTTALASLGRVSCAAHRGVRQMRRTCKVRRISCGLGLWHSHVAQLRTWLRSGRVSCANHRGVLSKPLFVKAFDSEQLVNTR